VTAEDMEAYKRNRDVFGDPIKGFNKK